MRILHPRPTCRPRLVIPNPPRNPRWSFTTRKLGGVGHRSGPPHRERESPMHAKWRPMHGADRDDSCGPRRGDTDADASLSEQSPLVGGEGGGSVLSFPGASPVSAAQRQRSSARWPPPSIPPLRLSPRFRPTPTRGTMGRKRDKPYFSRPAASSAISKRGRHLPRPDPSSAPDDPPAPKPSPPPALVVMGLSPNCSVLDLKSRFEIYGAISRIRIDGDDVGYVTYRSKDSADAAIAASRDPSFGVSVDSQKVQVLWSTDPLAKWREGVGAGVGTKEEKNGSTSKLLRAEVPLSRHGRVENVLMKEGSRPRRGRAEWNRRVEDVLQYCVVLWSIAGRIVASW
ncbi:hypothetical protein NL676_032387 [Syzygium grande]|nr:hypothetical protein NL676_032387 [Syzygium grande]